MKTKYYNKLKELRNNYINYIAVLDRYRSKNGQGRWYNLGLRELENRKKDYLAFKKIRKNLVERDVFFKNSNYKSRIALRINFQGKNNFKFKM